MNNPKTHALFQWIATFAVLLFSSPLFAQTGTVEIPYAEYQALLNQTNTRTPDHTVGQSSISVSVNENRIASVRATLSIRVFSSEWTAVRVLPAGVTLGSVTLSGTSQQLVAGPDGYFWITRSEGSHTLTINYTVPVDSFDGGRSIALPLPPSASTSLTANISGTGLGVAIIPAQSVTVSESGRRTNVNATLSPTNGAQISWRDDAQEGHTLSRVTYSGLLEGESVLWTMALTVDLELGERILVPILRQGTSLHDIVVDDQSAPITTNNGWFTVPVQGAGTHQVVSTFEVPIDTSSGPPGISFQTPQVPVSHFTLTLPGNKVISVSPAANVQNTHTENSTIADVHVSMTSNVTFRWSEAVPEQEEEEEVRANATLYHLAHAEEGVLYEEVISVFNVTHGETSSFEVTIPTNAQINRVEATDGSLSDWRVSPEEDLLTVFLNREVSGEYRFSIFCERSIGVGESANDPVLLPLFSANNVSRQRGMVALLSSRELGLRPENEVRLNRVGENQIPVEIRSNVQMTIAHTFRYLEEDPSVMVVPSAPEREQGRYDIQTDTLVSLGDVTTTVAAAIVVDVKSGSIMSLDLHLPLTVNFLNISAPSMREHEVQENENDQVIHVDFTQEMEGTFRVEIAYEQILNEAGGNVSAPLVLVDGADVEQGRIAVEALTAVEIQPESVEHLSTVDVDELPQQLVLRTTNPILLAYRYVQTDPKPVLGLQVTHHEEVEVQAAVIDDATYRTIYTEDGLAVTMARFIVRNSRQQFLRVTLPPNSEVWAATVAGQSETPALAESEEENENPQVLINIINSTQGFPVELVYATNVSSMSGFGRIEGTLPRPDVVVTQTYWDVYLPDGFAYSRVRTQMQRFYNDTIEEDLNEEIPAGIEIEVPKSGRLFSFKKLYANQSEEEIGFSIEFRSQKTENRSDIFAFATTILGWFGLLLLLHFKKRSGIALIFLGVIGATATTLFLSFSLYFVFLASFFGFGTLVTVIGGNWFVKYVKKAFYNKTHFNDLAEEDPDEKKEESGGKKEDPGGKKEDPDGKKEDPDSKKE